MIQLKNQLVIFDILSCMMCEDLWCQMWICGVGVDLWCRRCGSVEHVEVSSLLR